MPNFSREVVKDFVRDCEVLQALLIEAEGLTADELKFIEFVAKDLLCKVGLAKIARKTR
jgi:hypothetical protein